MKEKYVQSKVIEYARKKGLLCVKISDYTGFPDFVLINRNGKAAAIEFKAGDKGRVSESQRFWQSSLPKHYNVPYELVRTIDQGQEFVDIVCEL